MSAPRLTLVSHALCPYVQRAAIVLAEKNLGFERVLIDLADKPAWFRAISPLSKTPVLLVDGVPIFESAVICDYLDESQPPRLHPADALQRARHRGYVEFASTILNAIAGFYNAPDEADLATRRDELVTRFGQVETALAAGAGPWFDGDRFSIVDAAFAPVFRYFEVFEHLGDFGFFDQLPRVRAWRLALSGRDSVRRAASADYPQRLLAFLRARPSALGERAVATA